MRGRSAHIGMCCWYDPEAAPTPEPLVQVLRVPHVWPYCWLRGAHVVPNRVRGWGGGGGAVELISWETSSSRKVAQYTRGEM